MTPAVRVVLAVALFGACDPQAQAQPDQAAREFAVCMAACAGGHQLSATDRATCRLGCGAKQDASPASEGRTAAAHAVLLRFDTCAHDCGPTGHTDAASCRLNCAQQAPAAGAEHGFDRAQRGCAAACLDATVACEAECPSRAADAATCRLHCETAVHRCLRRCEAGTAASQTTESKGSAR